MHLTWLFLGIYFLIAGSICVQIVSNTKSSSKALAYILLIISFPVIGIIFYLSVGLNYRKRKLYEKKIEIDEKTFPELQEKLLNYSETVLSGIKPQLKHFFPLANFFSEKNLISDKNNLTLLINGERKFPELLQSIRKAKRFIHIEYYIYENDEIGNQIAELLIQKSKEGIKVRLIYDDFGSQSIRKSVVKRLLENGVEAYPFYKINLIKLANRLNYRNHRKIVVIDGLEGYVGGINISDKYINNENHELFWRDTHLKIEGLAVLNLQVIFMMDWNFCSNQNIGFSLENFPLDHTWELSGKTPVQIISSGPDSDYPNIMYSLIQGILLAKKEILITTPYFIPDKSFLDAIKIASLSGVTVKLLIPGISDSIFVNLTSNYFYQELLEAGVEIYKYSKGFVHAKTMVCDDLISVIGTANLDNRSFDLNFEVNATVFDENLANQMKVQFAEDLKVSQKIDLNQWKKRPRIRKFFERLAHLFSPLL